MVFLIQFLAIYRVRYHFFHIRITLILKEFLHKFRNTALPPAQFLVSAPLAILLSVLLPIPVLVLYQYFPNHASTMSYIPASIPCFASLGPPRRSAPPQAPRDFLIFDFGTRKMLSNTRINAYTDEKFAPALKLVHCKEQMLER